MKRIAALKKLYGDDAETHQVLNTLMEKGFDGYREVAAKMEAQADLRKRVEQPAQDPERFGRSGAGQLHQHAERHGRHHRARPGADPEQAGRAGKQHRRLDAREPTAVKWALRVVGVLSVLAIGVGAFGLSIASVLGPMLLARFFLARMGSTMAGAAARQVAGACVQPVAVGRAGCGVLDHVLGRWPRHWAVRFRCWPLAQP